MGILERVCHPEIRDRRMDSRIASDKLSNSLECLTGRPSSATGLATRPLCPHPGPETPVAWEGTGRYLPTLIIPFLSAIGYYYIESLETSTTVYPNPCWKSSGSYRGDFDQQHVLEDSMVGVRNGKLSVRGSRLMLAPDQLAWWIVRLQKWLLKWANDLSQSSSSFIFPDPFGMSLFNTKTALHLWGGPSFLVLFSAIQVWPAADTWWRAHGGVHPPVELGAPAPAKPRGAARETQGTRDPRGAQSGVR